MITKIQSSLNKSISIGEAQEFLKDGNFYVVRRVVGVSVTDTWILFYSGTYRIKSLSTLDNYEGIIKSISAHRERYTNFGSTISLFWDRLSDKPRYCDYTIIEYDKNCDKITDKIKLKDFQ